MSICVIKILACIFMVCDHLKYVIPDFYNFATLYIGRLAYPLFAFALTEGLIHTSDTKKYIKRLIVLAIVSQIPFMMFRTLVEEGFEFNIIFSFLLAIIGIELNKKIDNKFLNSLLCVTICIIGYFIKVDYSWYGIIIVFLYYYFKEKKLVLVPLYIGITMLFFYFNDYIKFETQYILYFITMALPSLLPCIYNGKEGRKIKYFYYAFYPGHLLLLYFLSFIFE